MSASTVSAPGCRLIYTVPSNKPFVDVLARHLLKSYGERPDALARALVLVPTRRSVTSLREALLRHSEGRPLLLPSIQPIGEIDLELIMPEAIFGQPEERQEEIPPSVSLRQRTFELVRLIDAFQQSEERMAGAEQSVLLAQALGDLIDDMAREEVDYRALDTVVEGELASHWQKTLGFLRIITEAWPKRLRELRRVDAVQRRSLMIRQLADYWRDHPPSCPVIAAGTTGSIPATAYLLEVIGGLPEGSVILPGLDQSSDDEVWQHVEREVSHPQYGLNQLLKRVKCDRKEVGRLDADGVPGAPEERMRFLDEVMIPARLSHRWEHLAVNARRALDGLCMLECADEEEESLAVALMLRDALEDRGKQAMLVTHDRALARRVAVLLTRYGLEVEDGGGMKLLDTPAAVLALLILRVAEAEAPADVLALLKHPLCTLGLAPEIKFKSVCEIELTFFRGTRHAETLASMAARAAETEGLSDEAILCMQQLNAVLEPMRAWFACPRVTLAEVQRALVTAMEAMAAMPEMAGGERLWSGAGGHLLSAELSDIYDHADYLGELEPATVAGVFVSLLTRVSYQPSFTAHPRVTILSPADARLQHADLVILAGLNEGCWPPAPLSDPWMSRAMRERIGLQPYERQIGLAAHDFISLCAAPQVIMTRSRKTGGTPRLASRWWLRLETVLEAVAEEEKAEFLARGQRWQEWVRHFRRREAEEIMTPPQPVPPLAARPRHLSVSQVERLMRDPYSFYAQAILKLVPLEPIDKAPGMAEFGCAVHEALEAFSKRYPTTLPPDAERVLAEMISAAFAELLHQVQAPTFWQRRLHRIVRDVIAVERERRPAIARIEAEAELQWSAELPGGPVSVRARADRLEYRQDGMVDLVDFKTGTLPADQEVKAGYAPQLTLEALMLQARGHQVNEMVYWPATGGARAAAPRPAGGVKAEPQQLIAEAEEGLQRLFAHYDEAGTPYLCQPDSPPAPRHNDYAHLERAEEWR